MIRCRPQVKITDSSGPPVTLAELREHGRIGATQVDAEYLQFLLDSASAAAEAYTDRVFLPQTREAYFPWFENHLQLPGAPLSAVSKVEYRDAAGTYQTLSSAVYAVDTIRAPGGITLVEGQSWPTTQDVWDAVKITYVAGYATRVNVPSGLRHAVLRLALHYYENREGINSMPPAIAADLREWTVYTAW